MALEIDMLALQGPIKPIWIATALISSVNHPGEAFPTSPLHSPVPQLLIPQVTSQDQFPECNPLSQVFYGTQAETLKVLLKINLPWSTLVVLKTWSRHLVPETISEGPQVKTISETTLRGYLSFSLLLSHRTTVTFSRNYIACALIWMQSRTENPGIF